VRKDENKWKKRPGIAHFLNKERHNGKIPTAPSLRQTQKSVRRLGKNEG